MTAVTHPGRARSFDRWAHRGFPLAVGQVVHKGGRAAIDLQTGKCVKVTEDPGLFVIGSFDRAYDATDGEVRASVDLGIEIEVEWLDNAETNPVTPADVGHACFYADDQTVTMNGAGRSLAGRVWEVDEAAKLVAVEKLQGAGIDATTSGGGLELPAFASNNVNVGAVEEQLHGGLFDIPATSAASTITLPASAEDGTEITFSADGVKNAHTVQYRDETGPTVLTTALTAAKRHVVICVKLDGTWRANAYVSP